MFSTSFSAFGAEVSSWTNRRLRCPFFAKVSIRTYITAGRSSVVFVGTSHASERLGRSGWAIVTLQTFPGNEICDLTCKMGRGVKKRGESDCKGGSYGSPKVNLKNEHFSKSESKPQRVCFLFYESTEFSQRIFVRTYMAYRSGIRSVGC